MSTSPLAGLLDRAARRDAGAFAAFYDGTIDEVYLLARLSAAASGGCEREAERIVRAAYCAAWDRCGSFRAADVSPTAWLMALVREAAAAPSPASSVAGTGARPRDRRASGSARGWWARPGGRDGGLGRQRPRARAALRG
ncbi:hypothetical protein GCM10023340_10130 [Nocardioides marinquilinus]|uniref:RNA polymerase sigma-70 region 2 domain-containing protein n=1 Tax=Nocardioides marinquilinus TaxID=1210400 RepID=A0ABP9PD19_9ACTN